MAAFEDGAMLLDKTTESLCKVGIADCSSDVDTLRTIPGRTSSETTVETSTKSEGTRGPGTPDKMERSSLPHSRCPSGSWPATQPRTEPGSETCSSPRASWNGEPLKPLHIAADAGEQHTANGCRTGGSVADTAPGNCHKYTAEELEEPLLKDNPFRFTLFPIR